MSMKECRNCHKKVSRYESICPTCHFCTILNRVLDDVEQLCITETLSVVSEPFILTEEETVLGYEKLFRKPIGLSADFDVTMEHDGYMLSMEEFETTYPDLVEEKRNTEIVMLGEMMEAADDLGGNALTNVRFWFAWEKGKPLRLNSSAYVYKVTPIRYEEELSDEKFQKIYEKIEIEYKNHNFNRNVSVGERNYNMIMRLIKSMENEAFDRNVVRLAAVLFGVEQKAIKLLAYYGDPEFASAQEFLEYQGVSAALAQKTEHYLLALRREFYVDWQSSLDKGKSGEEIEESKKLLDTVEGKILCDMVRLGKIGALGIASILKDSDYIYDPWESAGMMGEIDDYPFAVSDINRIMLTEWDLEQDFFTEEAKRIAEKRIKFMKAFAREYKIETRGEDEVGGGDKYEKN
ncbi:MAG: hypothetical protein IJ794_11195 [Lachnospiraceae bacterium]|nr:hypothetical protein [Lachnospiraceae bacterium]